MVKLDNNKYSFWQLLNKVYIQIPMIQRDYAQGRESAKGIREKFLDDLIDIIINNKTIHLDFVYGTVENDNLIPIDGQQRLTTLFLLHYYLALKDSKLNGDTKEILLKFTYETRISSREFLINLIEKEIKIQSISFSSFIRDQNWFFSEWNNDPTINSMLIVLDYLHQKLKYVEDELFCKLTQSNSIITFSFLNLSDFKLTNELYIKMNARGKPLSEFENFKSKFENYISDEIIKAKLDNEWLDIYWKMNKGNIKNTDRLYLNFFKNITAYYSNDFYNTNIFEFDYSSIVNDFIILLNELENYKDEYIHILRDDLNIFEDFLNVDSYKAEYEKRLRFYALKSFFIKIGSIKENNELFISWMRININIIHNTVYNKIDDYEKAISIIDELSDLLKKDFYKEISISSILNTDQFKEEKCKAEIIMDNPLQKWEDIFIVAEKNWYLDGEIGFLIELSKHNITNFNNFSNSFNKLWNFIDKKPSNLFLLQRALLTIPSSQEYIKHTKHKHTSRYTFCTLGKGLREKNENWRKVFNKDIFKTLLKEVDIKNIELSLQNMIDSYKFDYLDWKSLFINPNHNWTILDKIRNMQIQYNKDKIYLNRGQTSATSWGWYSSSELYSYYLYRYLLHIKFSAKPFLEIDYYISSNYESCLYFHNWNGFDLYISYYNGEFLIDLHNENIDSDKWDIELINLLNNENFILEEIYFYRKKCFSLNEVDELIAYIRFILDKVNEL